jgi:hypothetical protein
MAAAFLALTLGLAAGGQTGTQNASLAARVSHAVGHPVTCTTTGDLGIWREYGANTPLFSCSGSHRSWCVVEPPEPFRSLFRLDGVADVTGGMFAVFYRDAWSVRPACLRWSGVRRLASVGG